MAITRLGHALQAIWGHTACIAPWSTLLIPYLSSFKWPVPHPCLEFSHRWEPPNRLALPADRGLKSICYWTGYSLNFQCMKPLWSFPQNLMLDLPWPLVLRDGISQKVERGLQVEHLICQGISPEQRLFHMESNPLWYAHPPHPVEQSSIMKLLAHDLLENLINLSAVYNLSE